MKKLIYFLFIIFSLFTSHFLFQTTAYSVPIITYPTYPTAGGDTSWYKTDPGAVVINIDFDGAGVNLSTGQYEIGAGAWVDIFSPPGTTTYTADWGITWSSLVEGNNEISIRVYDVTGGLTTHNYVLSTSGFRFRKDTVAPTNPTRNGNAKVDNGSCTGADLLNDTWQKISADACFNYFAGSDATSGLAKYWIYYGTSITGDPTINNALNLQWVNGTPPPDGIYYFRIKTEDNAGWVSSPVTLYTIKFDNTPPTTISAVNDGDVIGADIDYTLSTTTLSANWSASSDSGSGLAKYWYAIGTTQGGTDVTGGWDDNGLNLSTTRTGLPLIYGTIYYSTVKAEDNAGNQSTTSSDGITVNRDWRDVYFPVGSDIGYVGGKGGILKTTNRGATWTEIAVGQLDRINSIYFPIDANLGYAVGAEGRIFKTTDVGVNWSLQTSGTTNELYDVNFPMNSSIGYAVGANGTIRKTINGGGSWTGQTSNTTNTLYSVHFPIDNTTGYAVGANGTILKTINGGSSWSYQTSGTTQVLYSVYFPVDTQIGYAVGANGTILKTINGGGSWSSKSSGTTEILYSVYFPEDNTTGYIVGANGKGLKTIDGGTNWSNYNWSTTKNLYSVIFPEDQTTAYGFAVGEYESGDTIKRVADTADGTAPSNISTVNDGTGADIKYQYDTTQLSANWTTSADTDSGIQRYWYQINSCGSDNICYNGDDALIVGWTPNGKLTSVTHTGLSLTYCQQYYFSVKAENGAGNYSTLPTNSDGVWVVPKSGTSRQTGNWSDPLTWGTTCGMPDATTSVTINTNHIVTYDLENSLEEDTCGYSGTGGYGDVGLKINKNGTLKFKTAESKSRTLVVNGNIWVYGTLEMRGDLNLSVNDKMTIKIRSNTNGEYMLYVADSYDYSCGAYSTTGESGCSFIGGTCDGNGDLSGNGGKLDIQGLSDPNTKNVIITAKSQITPYSETGSRNASIAINPGSKVTITNAEISFMGTSTAYYHCCSCCGGTCGGYRHVGWQNLDTTIPDYHIPKGPYGTRGVHVWGSSTPTNFTLQNSFIHDCYEGLVLQCTNGLTVSGNKIYNNYKKGIVVGECVNAVSGNVITNNVVHSNTNSSNDAYGIYIQDTDANTVQGNTVHSNNYGIYIYSAQDMVGTKAIKNNTIYNNTYHGIYLYDCFNNALENNKSYNNNIGIYSKNSNNNSFLNEEYGYPTKNTTVDMKVFEGFFELKNCLLNSDNKVEIEQGVSTYIISKRHDKTEGLTKIYGNYSIPYTLTLKWNYGDESYTGAGDSNRMKKVNFASGAKFTCNASETIEMMGALSSTPPTSPVTYSEGNVSVTNNNKIVTGVGTNFVNGTPPFTPQSRFKVSGSTSSYFIESVNSITQITLITPYQETSQSGISYIIDAPTLIQRDGTSGDYPFTVKGNIKAKNYEFRNLDATGLKIESGVNFLEKDPGTGDGLSYGVFSSIATGGQHLWIEKNITLYDKYIDNCKFDSSGTYDVKVSNNCNLVFRDYKRARASDSVLSGSVIWDPELHWTGETNYTIDGVQPNWSTLSSDNFTFRVKYTDRGRTTNGDPPTIKQVWIDLNDNGGYESEEKFTMGEVDPVDTNYTDGKLYTYTRFVSQAGDGVLKYRFYFHDNKSELAGVLTCIGEPNNDKTFGIDITAPTITDNQTGDDVWRSTNNGIYNVDFADTISQLSYFQTKVCTATGQGGTVLQDWTTVMTFDAGTSSYATDWQLLSTTFNSMNEGTNYVSVRVYDNVGNSSSLIDAFYVKKDITPPTITDNQTGDDVWRKTNNGIYNVDFADIGGSNLSHFQTRVCTVGGGCGTPLQEWTTVISNITTANYDTNWQLSTSTFTAMQEGINYVSVRVYDNAGNSFSTLDAFYVRKDTVAPTITDNQTGDDIWRNTNNGIYNVDFADTISQLSYFQIKVCTATGQGGTVLQDWTTRESGINATTYDTEWSVDSTTWNLTTDGTNYVSVRVYDDAGNSSSLTDAFYIRKDTTVPTTIATVKDGLYDDIGWTNSTTQLSANWTASTDAQSGIAKYWYGIGTTQGGFEVSLTIPGNVGGWIDTGSTNLSTTRTGLILANEQIYYFTVKAENGVGLQSAVVTNSNGQTVDTVLPTITNNQTEDSNWHKAKTTICGGDGLCDVDFADAHSKLSYFQTKVCTALNQGGTTLQNWTNQMGYDVGNPINATNYTTNWSLDTSTWNLATQGTNYVSVRVYDVAGNVSSTTVDAFYVKKDTTVPTAASLSSSTHSSQITWYNNNSPAYSWTASSDTGGSGVDGYYCKLSTTDNLTNTQVAASYDSYVVVPSTSKSYSNISPDGVHYFYLVSKDVAGNLSSVSKWTTKIDTSLPDPIAGINDVRTRVYSTGTVSVTNNSPTVTGSGTGFLLNVSVGDVLQIDGETIRYTVSAVSSATQITLSSPYTGTTGSGKSYTIRGPGYRVGTVTVTYNSTTVYGTNTQFLNNVFSGDKFKIASGTVEYTVSEVNTDIQLTLSSPYLESNQSGITYIITTSDITYTFSTTELSASWTASTDPHSGILKYWYGIWTTTSDPPNITGWIDTGSTNLSTTRTGLNLTNGQIYYFTVKAQNNAEGQQSAVTNSNGQTVDNVAPTITDNQTGDDTWRSSNNGVYDVDFSDNVLLSHFQTRVCSTSGGCTTPLQNWTTNTNYDIQGLQLATSNWQFLSSTFTAMQEGTNYVSVRVYDNAGNSLSSTDAFYVKKDTSPPTTIATVKDGLYDDIGWTNSTTQLSANWTASTDSESGIVKYWYKIHNCGADTICFNADDILITGWDNNGTNLSTTRTGFSLTNNQTYYFTVKAENGAGLQSTAKNSDGITVDTVAPTITDNQTGDDIWRRTNTGTYNVDFSDTGGSLLSYFQTRVCSTAGGCTTPLQDWTTVVSGINATSYTSNWDLLSSTWSSMQQGTNYISIRVYDNAGNTFSTLDAFYVRKDTTLPTITNNVTPAWKDTWRNTNPTGVDVDFADTGGSLLSYFQTRIYTGAGQSGEMRDDWTTVMTFDANTSTYSTNWSLAASTWLALQQGTNYVSVRVYDNAGNTLSSTDLFYVKKDTVIPTVTDYQSGDITWRRINNGVYNVNFSDAGSQLSHFQTRICSALGGCTTPLQDWTTVMTFDANISSYVTDWLLLSTTFNLMQEGTNYVSVRAYDNAGNVTNKGDAFYVKKDTSPPTPIATVNDGTGADIQCTASTTQLSANWTASTDNPGSGIAKYWYRIYKKVGCIDNPPGCDESNDELLTAEWDNNGTNLSTTRTGLSLINNQTYYFTVKAENGAGLQSSATNSDGQEVSASCLPVPSYVWDVTNLADTEDKDYTTSTTTLIAKWGSAAGATNYWYAIGTTAGGTQVTDGWIDTNSTSLSTTRTGLSLTNGQIYYFTVKGYLASAGSSSDGITVDITPPVVTDNQTGDDIWRTANNGEYNVDFSDNVLLSYFQTRVTTALGGGGTVLQGWTTTISEINSASYATDWQLLSTTFNLMQEGTNYVSVRVYDNAGNVLSTTDAFYVKKDTTIPTPIATVKDGLYDDIGWTNSTTQLSSNWTASTDAQSGITKYWYGIGTTRGETQTTGGWIDTGSTNLSTTRTGLNLINSQIYYFTVKAENGAGLLSATTDSNGQTVDNTLPTTIATVNDGIGADILLTPSIIRLSANWTESTDNPGSGIAKYWYGIGTTRGETQTTGGWIDRGLNLSVTHTGLNLIDGQIYYFTVRAENNAGLLSVAKDSDGQTVNADYSQPTTVAPVNDGTGADIQYTTSTTQLSANWTASSDPESGIVKYWYGIGTTKGETNIVNWTGVDNTYVTHFTSLTNGQIYYFTVKAENAAGLLSVETNSDGVRVDIILPAVTITSPTNNSVVKGIMNISVTALDDSGGSGIEKVEFYCNNIKIGESINSPYAITYNTTLIPDGNYTLSAKALDRAGNAASSYINIVINNLPPSKPVGLVVIDAKTGGSLNLSWTANSEGDLAGYNIYRSTTSAGTYLKINPLFETNNQYTDTGLTNDVTYWYKITAVDNFGEESEFSLEASGAPYIVFTRPSIPAGLSMMSIPLHPLNTDIGQILGINKIGRWDPVEKKYVYYLSSPTSPILSPSPGKGYWVKPLTQINNITISGLNRAQVDDGGYHHIPLIKGWNMIGNPFDFDVNFSECRANSSNITLVAANNDNIMASYAWTYKNESSGYQLVHPTIPNALRKLEPWYGYIILAKENCENCKLLVPNKRAKEAKEKPEIISDTNWSIQVKAESSNFGDTFNWCGVQGEFSKYKLIKPIHPEQKVLVYFEKEGDLSCIDYREPANSAHRWEFNFVVESEENAEVFITLDTVNLPKNYKIKLVDISSQQSAVSSQYTYNSGNGKTRKFKLIVEKPLVEIVENQDLNLSEAFSYPNPYRGTEAQRHRGIEGITFRYKASGNIQKVIIEVYNLAGRLVDKFEDTTIDGEVNWSFADRLANGVYIYRITITDGRTTKSKTGKMVIVK